MEYEGQICRPPMERSSFMLAAAVGCAYNQCRFCTLFKHLNYRLLPLDQVEEELLRVRNIGGNPRQVFLGDGNAFGMETSRLLHILERIFYYFPDCQMVNMDATVTDIHGKSDKELCRLKDAGVRNLYLGIESGLDDVLAFMRKDHNISQAYREIQRLQAAGMTYNAHIMTGIAGAGRGMENAENLAVFFNRTNPRRIINFSLFLHRNAPLYQDIKTGRFAPATEAENLQEAHLLLELLEINPLVYDGFHDQIEFRVRGALPGDRQKMLEKLDHAINLYSQREPVVAYS
ncbi:MAG: radical SAM protein [Lachnospiraceae bacterium]